MLEHKSTIWPESGEDKCVPRPAMPQPNELRATSSPSIPSSVRPSRRGNRVEDERRLRADDSMAAEKSGSNYQSCQPAVRRATQLGHWQAGTGECGLGGGHPTCGWPRQLRQMAPAPLSNSGGFRAGAGVARPTKTSFCLLAVAACFIPFCLPWPLYPKPKFYKTCDFGGRKQQ